MNAQLSLYNALREIDVPADKARAVIEAMEREMTTLLATKSDLATTQLLLRQDIGALRESSRQELHSVRDSLKQDIDALRESTRQELHAVRDSLKKDIESSRQELYAVRDSLKQDMTALRDSFDLKLDKLGKTLTLNLGSGIAVMLGLFLAAQKYL